jgi:ADP-heptose:LPS heptosyltransferase
MHRRLRDLATFLTIARNKFDCCIDFTRNDRSAFLAFLSGAQKRIVSFWVKRRWKIKRRAYNEFVRHKTREMHTIDYNLSLLEPLEIRDVAPPVHLDLPRPFLDKADALCRKAKVNNPFIIFHPGSARLEKFWEPARWADVIEQARKSWRIDALLTGGPSPLEQEHLAKIKSKLSRPDNSSAGSWIDLSGQTDLLTLTALISRARLIVTVDSAPMHLAAATGTPQVVLFGPTDPFHWHPRQSPALILQGDSPSPQQRFTSEKQAPVPMNLISTRAVIDAMDSLLSIPTK